MRREPNPNPQPNPDKPNGDVEYGDYEIISCVA